jgi:hypothetical protein
MRLFAKLAAILLLSTAAFAADGSTTKLTLDLSAPSTVAGTKLVPGTYTVYVTRNGDSANVRFKRNSKEVVNTNASFKPMSSFSGEVAVAQTQSHEVLELQSRKLGGAFVFNSSPQTDAPPQGSTK